MELNENLMREIDHLHAEICNGLADPKRIALLYAMRRRPLTVTQLSEAVELPQATVSRHLKVLRDRGMVTARREGMNVFYSVANDKIITALELLREVLSENLSQHGALAEALSD